MQIGPLTLSGRGAFLCGSVLRKPPSGKVRVSGGVAAVDAVVTGNERHPALSLNAGSLSLVLTLNPGVGASGEVREVGGTFVSGVQAPEVGSAGRVRLDVGEELAPGAVADVDVGLVALGATGLLHVSS